MKTAAKNQECYHEAWLPLEGKDLASLQSVNHCEGG